MHHSLLCTVLFFFICSLFCSIIYFLSALFYCVYLFYLPFICFIALFIRSVKHFDLKALYKLSYYYYYYYTWHKIVTHTVAPISSDCWVALCPFLLLEVWFYPLFIFIFWHNENCACVYLYKIRALCDTLLFSFLQASSYIIIYILIELIVTTLYSSLGWVQEKLISGGNIHS